MERAHRQVLRHVHPDKGGQTEHAQEVNTAKDKWDDARRRGRGANAAGPGAAASSGSTGRHAGGVPGAAGEARRVQGAGPRAENQGWNEDEIKPKVLVSCAVNWFYRNCLKSCRFGSYFTDGNQTPVYSVLCPILVPACLHLDM